MYQSQGFMSARQAAIAAVTTAGLIGGGYYAYQLYQRWRLPTEWTEVGTLANIYVYPVKSCAPVVKDMAQCSVLGLRDGWLRDRSLMLTDESLNFVTARTKPELLTIHPTVRFSELTLEHDLLEPITVDLAEVASNGKTKTATVWGCEVPVFDCGDQVADWLGKVLDQSGKNYRLVYYAGKKSRPLKQPTAIIYRFTKNDTGMLPDQVSYNLINEASVQDLNTRLEQKVTHRNFRPNFVLKGAQPYDEDSWKFVKIGDNVFEIIKPCFRCLLTTIDPETGVPNPKHEPLNCLKSYRLATTPKERKVVGSIPRMGLHMALRSGPGGTVSLGDRVLVA